MNVSSRLQVQNETEIQAPVERIWSIITDDPRYLSLLNPSVKKVTSEEPRMDAVRVCDVVMNGKEGTMQERCVQYAPHDRITWLVEKDSYGMSSMFSDVRFSFELNPSGQQSTRVISRSFYEPKHVFSRLMNALIMRRKFYSVQENILQNLKKVAEQGES